MLFITLLLALILLAATALVIQNARIAVSQETEATVSLAAALLGRTLPRHTDSNNLLRQFTPGEQLRHLCLRLILPRTPAPTCADITPPGTPAWFAALTRPEQAAETVLDIEGQPGRILIHADPADEIAEAWRDVRGLLALILLFYSVSLAAVFRSLGHITRPVHSISAALAGVEHGEFERRLPAFDMPEFDRLAARFNLMVATLERTRDENQRLHRHSLRIQETERQRLARELHDELGQSLTAIRADVGGILAREDSLPADVAESARAISDVAGRIYDQARSMMRRLRPPGLDELGLAPALEETVAGWQRQNPDVGYHLTPASDLSGLDPEIAIHVFRIVQEALTNAHRHASPGTIRIRLAGKAEQVTATIEDDGDGFDPARMSTGVGISGMRERAELLGGKLQIDSRPGRGTRVHASLPRTPPKNREVFPLSD